MVLIRRETRKIVHLPIGSIIALAICTVLGLLVVGVGGKLEVLVSASIFEAITLALVISRLHVIQRVEDELILRWSFGTKRWMADDHGLRAGVRGTKTPSLQLELIARDAEFYAPGTVVAELEPNAKGRAEAEAIALVLGLPLTNDPSDSF